MRRIVGAVQREWRLKIFASTVLTLVGAALGWLLFRRSVILVIIGLALGVTGLRLLFRTFREAHDGGHRLLRLLEEHPQQIVWVYSVVTERLPFGFRFNRSGIMYFKLADGDEITLSLPAGQIKGISQYLNDRLPHATFGYTRDREQWFMASPYLLLKAEER